MLASTIIKGLAAGAALLSVTTATPIANPDLVIRDDAPKKYEASYLTATHGPNTGHWHKMRVHILEQHNIVRMAHHSPNLTWSTRLAADSQKFTNLCKPGEGWASLSPGHGSNSMNCGGISEDSYMQATTDAIQAWAGEEKEGHLSYDPVRCGGVCGHFEQMVWKKTTQVGCSWNNVDCPGLATFQCYYNPPGNIQGQENDNVLKP